MASLLCVTTPLSASTWPHAGVSISAPLVTKDPEYLHGWRAAVWYQPESLIWTRAHLYFDASFGHWWVSNNTPNQSLSIYSVSPVFRLYFMQNHAFSPFLNASVGLAWMTRTRIDHQNLGMHFAFQDQLGIGATFGSRHNLSISLSALHYSNGSFCKNNAGITIPIMLNAEYGFA
ncbi:MAG TPA: acyloxyacyl hydrolase [Gammaproteobacteria bacterium]|nr:acyloxyacyl hydrolase [Gammaproteobacteria bacterium]